MTSRNRGKKKLKLRDLSREHPTAAESDILGKALADDETNEIAVAIIGCAMVEHQLDILLRRHFHRKDDDAWEQLLSDNGPLRNLFAKIVAAHAFGIVEEPTRFNLDVIREIRNAFAHARRPVSFDHPLIEARLSSIKEPKRAKANDRRIIRDINDKTMPPKRAFAVLCTLTTLILLRRQNETMKSKTRRLKRKLRTNTASPYVGALSAALGHPVMARPSSPSSSLRALANPLLGTPDHQTDDPTNSTLAPSRPKGYGRKR